MRTIKQQVIASTSLDRQGDSIPREVLQTFFDQLPDSWPFGCNHDPSHPAIARGYNKTFGQLESGTWAIRADIDVLDEASFERNGLGGVSIAYGTMTMMLTDRSPEVVVMVNPRLIPLDEFWEIARHSTNDCQINVKDIHQKGIEIPAFVFLAFASASVASGFFKAIGADLYSLLKNKIKQQADAVKEKHGAELICQMTFEFQHRDRSVEILATVRAADIDVLANRGISAEEIVDTIRRNAVNKELRRVIVRVSNGTPSMLFEYHPASEITDLWENRPT